MILGVQSNYLNVWLPKWNLISYVDTNVPYDYLMDPYKMPST